MRADVVVVGAGTAGAATALACARRGLSVFCVDRRPLGAAGARWINGVPGWMFDEAGVERPVAPELFGSGEPFHLLAGWGPERIVLHEHALLDVDMRLLVARLQRAASDAGVELLGEATVRGFDGARLDTTRGTLEAKWFVDASGLGGARLLGQPAVDARHLCAASQEVREVKDPVAARALFEEHGVRIGETLCFSGIAGGFSIVNVRLVGPQVSLLTGSIPGEGHRSGQQILSTFVKEHPFIGDLVFGGSRAIPLRRPYDRLAGGRVALVGDAACQVFSAHGSGIGIGMIAGRMLADALAEGRGVHGYAVAFQRKYGGLLGAYDLFRRFSQRLSADDIARMMKTGLMDSSMVGDAMAERLPALHPRMMAAKLGGIARQPAFAARLGPVTARMLAAQVLYATYPKDPSRLERWSRRAARTFGDPADPAAAS